MSDQKHDDNKLIAERRAKLEALRDVEPQDFGDDFRDALAALIAG